MERKELERITDDNKFYIYHFIKFLNEASKQIQSDIEQKKLSV